jgi:protein ImuA
VPNPSHAFLPHLDALRAEVRAIELVSCRAGPEALPFGIEEIDRLLAGRGLAAAALHEFTGSTSSLNDDAATTLFAAGIAARLSARGGTVLWAMSRRDLFAPALRQAGLPPDRLLYAQCGRDEDVLAVMEEGLRHQGLAAVVGEIGRAAMTSTRRVQLMAEESVTMALMLRRWPRGRGDPLASPSAAATRWRIGCMPSRDLPVSGIARPRWHVELVRQRGGPSYQWILEGTDEAGRLALPAEPSHRPVTADRGEALDRHAA